MRTIFYIIICCVLAGIAPTIQAQEGTVTVKLNKASLRGQTLDMDLDIRVNHVYIASSNSLSLTLALQSGQNIVHLPPVIIHGTNKRQMFERTLELRGLEEALGGAHAVLKNDADLIQLIPYKRAIAYRPWMNKCQLILIGEILDYNNNPIDTFTDVLERSVPIRKSSATTRRRPATNRK